MQKKMGEEVKIVVDPKGKSVKVWVKEFENVSGVWRTINYC